MSDARQSPIPQDRVNENIDQGQRARDSRFEKRTQDRHIEQQARDEQPEGGSSQPGMPETSDSAEGGD